MLVVEASMDIVCCVSCEGYGWYEDDLDGSVQECDWCSGVGYVYQENGVDRRIPPEDWGRMAARLEALEQERLRGMGYTGSARKPWEQDIRQGTKGGENPYE